MSPEAPTYVCPENSGFGSLKRSLCLFWFCRFWGWFERQGKFTKCVSRWLHHVSRRRNLDVCRIICRRLSGIVDLGPKTRQKFVALPRFKLYCLLLYSYPALPYMYLSSRLGYYPVTTLQPHTTVLYRIIPASNPLSLCHCNVSCVKRSTQVHIHMKRYTTTLVLLRSHS